MKLNSIVTVVCFALYRRVGKPGQANAFVEVLSGAESGRMRQTGGIELVAGSTPYLAASFDARRLPAQSGIFVLYGTRDMMDALSYWHARARELDAEFASAEIDVEVGYIEPGMLTRERLRELGDKMGFANMRRLRAAVQGELLSSFASLRPEAGIHMPLQLAQHPDLWPAALEMDPDLRHLKLFAVPVADTPTSVHQIRQVALLRPGAKIRAIRQLSSEADIVLPAWLTAKDHAKDAAVAV